MKKASRWGCLILFVLFCIAVIAALPSALESYRATATAEALTEAAALPTRTASPTDGPTPTATITPTVTETPGPTEDSRPTLPTTWTPTTAPTQAPIRTPQPLVRYATTNANARSCPQLDCQIVGTLSRGDTILVEDQETGDMVGGNSRWFVFTLYGQTAYVHSSLVSATQPEDEYVPPLPASGGQQSPPPTSSGYTYNCSKTCGAMASCEEAYFQLQCGCSQRDGDSDGVPCESICPGG